MGFQRFVRTAERDAGGGGRRGSAGGRKKSPLGVLRIDGDESGVDELLIVFVTPRIVTACIAKVLQHGIDASSEQASDVESDRSFVDVVLPRECAIADTSINKD